MDLPVVVSKDGLEARVAIAPAEARGHPVEACDITAALAASNVVYGLRTEAIRAAIAAASLPGALPQEVVAARGDPPVNGTDAAVDYTFVPCLSIGHTSEKGDRVDYRERGYFHEVRSGDLLARKTPATPGTPGRDVHGRPIPARSGIDAAIKVTEGAELSPDGLECRATRDGVVVAAGAGSLGVFEKYTIHGDVDLNTGNLNMNGALAVQGWIRAGFHAHATGDFAIDGGVEPSVVDCDSNLTVHGGIFGDAESKVECRGALAAQFIENATVRAAGDITVAQGILNSRVASDGQVAATQGKGYIIGGTVRATRGVDVNELGSPSGTPTLVDVGLDDEARAKLSEMERECEQYERNRPKIVRTLGALAEKNKTGKLSMSERQAIEKLARYRRDIERTRERVAAWWKKADPESAVVRVHTIVYDGTTLVVFGRRLDVHSNLPAGEFVLNADEGRVMYRI